MAAVPMRKIPTRILLSTTVTIVSVFQELVCADEKKHTYLEIV